MKFAKLFNIKLVLVGFFVLGFLVFSTNSAYAIRFCGIRNVDPVNSGNPNPMKTIKGLGSVGTQCGYDVMRFGSDPAPQVIWEPEFINWGTPGFYEDFTFYYQVSWHKLNNYNDLSCTGSWESIDNSPFKFPQDLAGSTDVKSTHIAKAAGTPASIFNPSPPPSHKVTEIFTLEKFNGAPLDDGVYQIDIVPSCDGGNTFDNSISLGATFVKIGCETPTSPRNLSVSAPLNVNEANSLSLNWDAPVPTVGNAHADVGRYEIYRTNPSTGVEQLIANVGADVTNYKDTNLNCNSNYSYKVRAIGCGVGSFSDPVTGKTNNNASCDSTNCTLIRGDNASCLNSNKPSTFLVNDVSGSVDVSLWDSNTSGTFSTSPDLLPNEVRFTPSQVNNSQDTIISYGSNTLGSIYCQDVVKLYPEAAVEVELREAVNGCTNYSTNSIPLSGVVVGLSSVSTNELKDTNTANTGVARFNNVQIRKPSGLTCLDIDYKVQISRSTLDNSDVSLCSQSIVNTDWEQVAPNLVYNISSIDPDLGGSSSSPVFRTPTIYFEKSISSEQSNWITVNQGDFRVESKYSPVGETGDVLIEAAGTLFSEEGYNLGSGVLGPNVSAKNVHDFSGYNFVKDYNDILTLISTSDFGISEGNCGNIPNEYSQGLIKLFCNPVLSDTQTDPSKYPVVYVEGDVTLEHTVYGDNTTVGNFMYINGDLNIAPGVEEINVNIVVSGDISIDVTNDLVTNGFLVSESSVTNENYRLDVNSNFTIFDNEILRNLLSESISNIYRIRID